MAYVPVSIPYPIRDEKDPVAIFARKYEVLEVTTERRPDRYGYGYSYQDTYLSPYDNNVNIKMSVRSFMDMAKNDAMADHDYDRKRFEQYMRSKHEIIQDAYEKYQMLLALMEK